MSTSVCSYGDDNDDGGALSWSEEQKDDDDDDDGIGSTCLRERLRWPQISNNNWRMPNPLVLNAASLKTQTHYDFLRSKCCCDFAAMFSQLQQQNLRFGTAI